jgi:hypothetical protein
LAGLLLVLALGVGLIGYFNRHWFLPAPPPAQSTEGPTAEELFRKFEKQVEESKTVFIAYVGERKTTKGQQITRSYYAGTYHAKPKEAGEPAYREEHRCEEHTGGRALLSATHPNHFPFGPITRNGFFFGDTFYQVALWDVADFQFVEPKPGADPAGSKIIAYTHHVPMLEEKGPGGARQMMLWLDEKSLAPLKRTVRMSSEGEEFEVTEHYFGFTTGEIPAFFERLGVAVFVASGRVSAKIGTEWVPMHWLVEGVSYRADQETILANWGTRVRLALGSEFTVADDPGGYPSLQLIRGRFSAELGPRRSFDPVLGPVRLANWWHTGGHAAISGTPDRVVVEHGGVEFAGVSAEPSSRIGLGTLTGHQLQEGVEYHLVGRQPSFDR